MRGKKRSYRQAKDVYVVCNKCNNGGIALEGTIWKCNACGQANAVLSAGPVKHEEDLPEPVKKVKLAKIKAAFDREAQQMLHGKDDLNADTGGEHQGGEGVEEEVD